MSNTVEGIKVDVLREFKLFDALPEWLRVILREDHDDIHVEPVARFYVELKKRNLSQQYMSYEIRRLIKSQT